MSLTGLNLSKDGAGYSSHRHKTLAALGLQCVSCLLSQSAVKILSIDLLAAAMIVTSHTKKGATVKKLDE